MNEFFNEPKELKKVEFSNDILTKEETKAILGGAIEGNTYNTNVCILSCTSCTTCVDSCTVCSGACSACAASCTACSSRVLDVVTVPL